MFLSSEPSTSPEPLTRTASPCPASRVRLQLIQQGHLAAEWRFTRTFRIGHDAACEVRLDDPRVQAYHTEVYLDGATWRVRDLGKRRDTLVNGAQVQEIRLGSPSTLQLGLYGPLLHLTLEPHQEATAANGCVTAPARPPSGPRLASPPPEPRLRTTAHYHGHGFTVPLPEEWRDQTLYTLSGPVADGLRHTVLVEVDPAPETDVLDAYVDAHLRILGRDLDGFRLLKKDEQALSDGTPAVRLIFCWKRHGRRPLYQEQLLILHKQKAYKLTATFTNASRKRLGGRIEAMMLGFMPASC